MTTIIGARLAVLALSPMLLAMPASAENCQQTPLHFLFTDPPEVYHTTFEMKAGTQCRRRFGSGSIALLKDLILQEFPSHGKVTLKEDGSALYVPAAGYRGRDSFTLRLCAEGLGRRGCADIEHTVVIN